MVLYLCLIILIAIYVIQQIVFYDVLLWGHMQC